MIVDNTITEFINELKSAAPTPGGGGVAALNSANGVALIMMVANLTIHEEKYMAWHLPCRKILFEAQNLLDELTAGIDKDAEEFGKVIEAYKLPHSTDEELSARSTAIGEASIGATQAPLNIMACSIKGMELVKKMLGRSNPNVESDLFVATLSLYSGLLSAQYSVNANLEGIGKVRPEAVNRVIATRDELVRKGYALSMDILSKSEK